MGTRIITKEDVIRARIKNEGEETYGERLNRYLVDNDIVYKPSPIYVEACMSPDSLYDAGLLWCAWAAEQDRQPYIELWLRMMSQRVASGWWESGTDPPMAVPNSWLLIARDKSKDDKAVGMVEIFFTVDPMEGGVCCFGDHAFVLAEYRKTSVFSKLAHQALTLGSIPGVKAQILSMEPDSVLGDFYREFANGEFKKYAVCWRRQIDESNKDN